MPARKARKLADGSREETYDESDNFSVDDEFSVEPQSRVHKSLENSQSTAETSSQDETMSEDEQQSSSFSSADENVEPVNNDELLADCGTIESLTLSNFMCHEHFEITFNPRVNFVIGKNGSK